MLIERLKSLVKEGNMDGAVYLSIFPDIPSGPEALLVSIASNRLNTSFQYRGCVPEALLRDPL